MVPILAGAAALAAVHLFAGRLRFLDVVPRSRWLSFASGISVAYVFVHLLPELSAMQEVLRATFGREASFVEHPAFLLAAAGLAAFYGLERLAERSRAHRRDRHDDDATSARVFWLHIASFALYNVLIGYLLADRRGEMERYLLFLFAMALHFFVNDFGLREHHKRAYHDRGRWILAVAVVAGALLGETVRVPEYLRLAPLAFLGGAVILNVLKEELPRERESRFWAFALGLGSYTAILLAA